MTTPCGCTCSPRPNLLNCIWPNPPSATLDNCSFGRGGVASTAFPLFAPTRWKIITPSVVILSPVGGAVSDVWESDTYTSGGRTWHWSLEFLSTAAADITLKKIYSAHPDGDFPGEIIFTARHNLHGEGAGLLTVCIDRDDYSIMKWFSTDFPCCYQVSAYDGVETLPVPGTLFNHAAMKWRSSDAPAVYTSYECHAVLGGFPSPYADYTSCYFESVGVFSMGFKLAINCDTCLLDLYEKPNGTGGGFAGTRLVIANLPLTLTTPITWTGLPNIFGVTREWTIESFSTT